MRSVLNALVRAPSCGLSVCERLRARRCFAAFSLGRTVRIASASVLLVAAQRRRAAVAAARTVRATRRGAVRCARASGALVHAAFLFSHLAGALLSATTPPQRARSAVMSSDVLARVQAFAIKADELHSKGHLLLAAENFGRAAEAACALGADNLVALDMQLSQSSAHMRYATASATAIDTRIRSARGAEGIALLCEAVSALERRRVAGTLLEGKCAALEEAWHALEMQRDEPDLTASEVASWAPLVGYALIMNAATSALNLLLNAGPFAAECSVAQLEAFA